MCLTVCMVLILRKIMNTDYYLPFSKFFTYWHAAYFFIWCQVFLYPCHRQCKQCISSFICSQLQFSSDPTDQPSFLLLPFSCRAASPTFLLPTSFYPWKQSKPEQCTHLFHLLLMFVPGLYSLPWRSHLESSKKSLKCREKSVICNVLLVLNCPNEQEVCRTGSSHSSPSLPEGFTWNEQPGERLWKGPNNVMWLGGLQAGQNAPTAQLSQRSPSCIIQLCYIICWDKNKKQLEENLRFRTLLRRLGHTAHCTGQSKAVCLVHSFKMHE